MLKYQLKYIVFCTIVFITLLNLTSCIEQRNNNVSNTDNKLDVALINNPRSADGNVKHLSEMPTMDFKDTTFDFGKMYEGEVATHEFEFVNNGKMPLLISNAAGTCGCTVPQYPKTPIAPGEKANIVIKFNSLNKVGLQNKTINIYTNSNKGLHALNITAEVLENN